MVAMELHSESKTRARLAQYLDNAGYGAQTKFADLSGLRREVINRFMKGGGVNSSTLQKIESALDTLGAPVFSGSAQVNPWDGLAGELERLAVHVRDSERDPHDRMNWLKSELQLLNHITEKIERGIRDETQ